MGFQIKRGLGGGVEPMPSSSKTEYSISSSMYSNLFPLMLFRVSLVAQTVKNSPAMQETRIRSLGWEDPLEKGMATHSSVLAWIIPWTKESGGLQSTGSQRVGHNGEMIIYINRKVSRDLQQKSS